MESISPPEQKLKPIADVSASYSRRIGADPLRRTDLDILVVPGLDNSGPRHWQTLWEHGSPAVRRAQLRKWSAPVRSSWRQALGREVIKSRKPIILVAHSLGCLAVVDWALSSYGHLPAKILGALLVAPPDVEQPSIDDRLLPFAPWPRGTLPFPSILAASRNDRYATIAASADMAARWGSRFVDWICGSSERRF